MDRVAWLAFPLAMPISHSGRIVYAKPPAKRRPIVRAASSPSKAVAVPSDHAAPQFAPAIALATFHKLSETWAMPPAWAWRMLTGVGWQAGSLTEDQAVRVAHLVAIDAAMKAIGGQTVGTWMVTGNPAPLLGGAAPVDYLAKRGMAGYAALLRQVQRWTEM